MKKVSSLIITSLMIIAFFSSCSNSKQAKTETVKAEPVKTEAPDLKVKAGGDSMVIDEINNMVKGFYITGFPGGSSKLKKSEDLENMKKIVALIKPIIAKVPEGYVMQITGHCADYESAAKQKRVSNDRAAKIFTELKKSGVAAKKMTFKGAGSSEPIEGYSGKDVKQRSVSFKAVKK